MGRQLKFSHAAIELSPLPVHCLQDLNGSHHLVPGGTYQEFFHGLPANVPSREARSLRHRRLAVFRLQEIQGPKTLAVGGPQDPRVRALRRLPCLRPGGNAPHRPPESLRDLPIQRHKGTRGTKGQVFGCKVLGLYPVISP